LDALDNYSRQTAPVEPQINLAGYQVSVWSANRRSAWAAGIVACGVSLYLTALALGVAVTGRPNLPLPWRALLLMVVTFALGAPLFGQYARPVARTVLGEIGRSAIPTAASLAIGLLVLSSTWRDRALVVLILSLPLILLMTSAINLSLNRRDSLSNSPDEPIIPETDLKSANLHTLMHALAQRVVDATNAHSCRLFTISSDGEALVLRGAGQRHPHPHVSRVGDEPRLRLQLSSIEEPLAPIWNFPPNPLAEHPLPDSSGAIARALAGASDTDEVSLSPLWSADNRVGMLFLVHEQTETAERRAIDLQIAMSELFQRRSEIGRAIRMRANGVQTSASWRVFWDWPGGAIALNAFGRVLAVNMAGERSLNLPSAALVRTRLCAEGSDCLCPFHRSTRSAIPIRAPLGEILRTHDLRIATQASLLWPVRNLDGALELVLVLLDATSVNAPESPSATTDLLAMISHELRTPLTTLQMSTELALDSDSDPDGRSYLLETIARQARRMDQLTSEVLETFKPRAGHLLLQRQVTDVTTVCTEVLDELRASGDITQALALEPCDVARIAADEAKLRIILRNLVSNAAKYSPPGTTITVSISSADRGVTLSVQDEGPGIDESHVPRIFDRYYRFGTPAEKHESHGLGLFIVRALAELHGGCVWVDTTPGKGSRFTVFLPARDAPENHQSGAECSPIVDEEAGRCGTQVNKALSATG
jgi:signal transduction histidine kinase